MKLIDEFRDPVLARRLVDSIRQLATQRWTIMEVCGGQTHGLLRHGIDQELSDVVELLHGPGCPVCVTPAESIDRAIELALRPGVLLTTFGDMLRVPGTGRSLMQAQAEGAKTRMVYSPLDAVKLAQEFPTTEVVFFAVGFETTAPATALAVSQAAALGLKNFSVLMAHVRVLPAMEAIAQAPECRVQGFLAAGHVCTVTGYDAYRDFSQQYRLPIVVTGFEPVDLLDGLHRCVQLLEQGSCEVINAYGRSVRVAGNLPALEILREVFEIHDQAWRGLGVMPRGGYSLAPAYRAYDATTRFSWQANHAPLTDPCPSGEVMSGRIRPTQCPHFGTRCTPQTPLGAPMVSTEGACNAYVRYSQHTPLSDSNQK